MGLIRPFLFLIACLLIFVSVQSQDSLETKSLNKKRLRTVVIGSGIIYGAAIVGLSELWYKNSEQQSFRFFNDNAEWKQVDKLGHFYGSFYASYGSSNALKWCGVNKKKSE